MLQKVERLGAKAIIFTVDVGWVSKRTLEARINKPIPESLFGAFMAMGGLQDRNLSWDDIAWIRVRILSTLVPLFLGRKFEAHTYLGSAIRGFQSLSKACRVLKMLSYASNMALKESCW